MLCIAALLRMSQPQEHPPNDLMAQARMRLGYLGFTLMALVYILVSFWQR
jgi:hypothetical protein